MTLALLCFLVLGVAAGDELDENGLRLCVTLESQIQDLSRRNLTLVPWDLPSGTQYLDLSFNTLPALATDAFSKLRDLCFLKMVRCGLAQIAADTFEKTPLLKVLVVSQNKLALIPDLPLPNLQILDLSMNSYKSYKLPSSFRNFTHLDTLALGSANASSVLADDFDSLRNVSVRQLILGSGTEWRTYDSGCFAKLRFLQKLSLKTPFCGNLTMLEAILKDLNQTEVTAIRFVHVFPNICNVSINPFASVQSMPRIQNLTLERTLVNTSFLEMFIKDILSSTIRGFSFVNITYNEDTPNGFQLWVPDRPAPLQFITINGINHYQYKYPTFNGSVELVSNLTYIKFSKTGLNILPCKLMSEVPGLEILDLSDNILTNTGFWWPACPKMTVFPKLKQLSLSKNRFGSISFIAKNTHQMKLLESLDLSFNSIFLDNAAHWPPWLKEINLANNNLDDTVFNFLSPHFERIDLSRTGLTVLMQNDISKFPKLTDLILSGNSLQFIPPNLRAPSLRSLSVDQNAITLISEEDLAGLSNMHTLKAGNNPFICSCDSLWFVTSLNKSLLSDWPLHYTCGTPPSYAGKSLTAVEELNTLSCETRLQAAIALALLFLVTSIGGFVFWKCDGMWYVKMLWVWIQMKRHKRAAVPPSVAFKYHAFISYSHHDSDWVDSQLVACLEGAGLTLCIHERDFVPGEWILDNIINCMESSYKTLFVLSKQFVQSEWCNYELFFAHQRSISVRQESLVFLLLEPIPYDSLPQRYRQLRTVLRRQTYLGWPQDERKRKVFWASLKAMLRGADRFMALRNAALELAERATAMELGAVGESSCSPNSRE